MTIPAEIAEQLSDEAVGAVMLVELDTTEGFLRFMVGENGVFTDANGVKWLGSTLVQIGEVEAAINGIAPSWEMSLSYVHDPERGNDPIAAIREYGVAAIDGRKARLYFQYFGRHEEMYAPIWEPIRLTTRIMRKLSYSLQGEAMRTVSVLCEGPFPLKSRPVNGRYTDADQRRRHGGDPSLEFMPVHGFDDEPLFGL